MTQIKNDNVNASIDVLLDYKRGTINLEEAVSMFSFLTGMRQGTCEKYIGSMSRENVVQLREQSSNIYNEE